MEFTTAGVIVDVQVPTSDWSRSNPLRPLLGAPRPPPSRVSPTSMFRAVEPTEVLSVLRAARAKGSREWAMIVVAYKHGLRASEVCNLRLDDLDMKNGSIVVERLKGSLLTTQAVTEHRGEPLLNELKALREWLRQRSDDGSDYLLPVKRADGLIALKFFGCSRLLPVKLACHRKSNISTLSSTRLPVIWSPQM